MIPSIHEAEVYLLVCNILFAVVCSSAIVNTPLPSPLEVSTHDLAIKTGNTGRIFLTPTKAFNEVFHDAENVVLIWDYTTNGIISEISSIPLIVNGSHVINETIPLEITAVGDGAVVVTSEFQVEPVLNLTYQNKVFFRIITFKSSLLSTISDIIGWIYFIAWSISFYPQIYQNWRRKSVRGLSLDFVFLNVTGFFVYGMYNVGLYWSTYIQEEFFERYPTSEIPVQLNDVIFTLHAIIASGITMTQCLVYDKGSQTISRLATTLLGFIYIFIAVMLTVALSNQGVTWLTFLTVCSYIKLLITLVKYIPQAYMNWSRKSTSGWCIGNVLLDITGGLFSLLQMVIIGYNHNDWWSLLTDLTKLGLGVFSICFDILFIVQHYCLYRNHEAYEPIEGNNPRMDPYEDLITSNHIQNEDEMESISQRSISSDFGKYSSCLPPLLP